MADPASKQQDCRTLHWAQRRVCIDAHYFYSVNWPKATGNTSISWFFFWSRGQLMAIFRFDTFDWWYSLVVKEKEVLAHQSLRIRGNLHEIVIQTYKLVCVWLSKCILHTFYNTHRFQVYVVKQIMHPLSSLTEKTQVQHSYLWNKKKRKIFGSFISSNIFLYHPYLKKLWQDKTL